MIITVLGTTFKIEDIQYITPIYDGHFKNEFHFEVVFKMGPKADIRLSSEKLTSGKTQEDRDYTLAELERVRKELIKAWQGIPTLSTINANNKPASAFN